MFKFDVFHRFDGDNVFARPAGRVDGVDAFIVLHAEDGDLVTRMERYDGRSIWPLGSDLGTRYEHPEGIYLTREQCDELGIPIED